MESIKNWAFSFSIAAIIGSVLNIILPECPTQKTFKIISCVFFMCAVISPLKNIDLSFLDNNFESKTYLNEIETMKLSDTSAKYLESRIAEETKQLLKKEGIYPNEILIKVNISENDSIDINKFVLNFGYLKNPSEIAEKVYKKIGIEPEIILSGES